MSYQMLYNFLMIFFLFSIVHKGSISVAELIDDIVKISHWLYQWKTSFNQDLT